MSDSDEVEFETDVDHPDPFPQSLAEKMQIARNVVIECHRMQNAPNRFHSGDIQNIINYTGVCENTIRLADVRLQLKKTFNDWFEERQVTEPDEFCFLLGSIRGTILELYTKKVQVATKDKLIKALLHRRWMRVRYEQSRLKKDINRHGFTWKRLPGTKKSIMVERTEQSLKRMEYLAKMRAYREGGRTIAYVDAYFYYYQLVVSPQCGLLHMGFHGLKKNGEKCLETWTQNVLISVLPPNSVVVLKEDPVYETKFPTPNTPKSDMIKWLTNCKIPHEPSLHRADLYAIIKKFKHLTVSDSAVDRILKSYGHDIVYRPKELKSLDYLEIMWPGVPGHRCKTDTIVKLKETTLTEWQNIEKILVSREEKMYQEDILLEAVVDRILTLAKYGELSAADLEECDDELPEDEYYSSIIIE